MRYSQAQVQDIARKLLQDTRAYVTPIGNHELNRHLVYRVDGHTIPVVLKIYYKENRRNREIAAHHYAEAGGVKAPKLLDYGVLESGREWMMYEFVEGTILEDLWPELDDEDLECAFTQIGEQLGKLHRADVFDFFGEWDETGQPNGGTPDFKTCFIRRQESYVETMRQYDLPEEHMLESAIALMRELYVLVDAVQESRLCHRDYDGRNILFVRENGQLCLTGVIDFEQSTPYYAGTDLVNLYRKYFIDSPNLEAAFKKGYEAYMSIDKTFWEIMDYLLLCLGIGICSWSYDDARPHYYEGIRILEFLRIHSKLEF